MFDEIQGKEKWVLACVDLDERKAAGIWWLLYIANSKTIILTAFFLSPKGRSSSTRSTHQNLRQQKVSYISGKVY